MIVKLDSTQGRRNSRRTTTQLAAERLATMDRPLCFALAVVSVALFAALAVCNAEDVDSGWAVAKPSTSFDANRPSDPSIRIAINHVLEQSQLPLLKAPSRSDTTT